MTNQTLLSPSISLECPKCGKHTIVEQPTGTYRCIACDFKRDFARDDSKFKRLSRNRIQPKNEAYEGDVSPFPLLLIGGILLVLLV